MGDFTMSKALIDVLGQKLAGGASSVVEKAQELFEEVFVTDPSEDIIGRAEEIGHHLDMNWRYVVTGTPELGYLCEIDGATVAVDGGDTPEEAIENARIELSLMFTRQQKKGQPLSEPPPRPASGRY